MQCHHDSIAAVVLSEKAAGLLQTHLPETSLPSGEELPGLSQHAAFAPSVQTLQPWRH